MTKPKVIFFDVNETLLDLAPLKTSVGAALGGREDLLPLWFTTLLHYSLVDTLNDDYRDFRQIGVAVLMMIAEKQGIAIDRPAAEAAVMEPFLALPAHADVRPTLEILSKAGFRLVSLTNTSTGGITAQFKFAGIIDYFEQRISTEEIGAFKPDARVYQHALKAVNVPASDVLMIAAHAWDLAGAKKAGLQTAFIRRPGATLYPNVARPDYVVDSLTQLTALLTN
jgi:2-haloacid dehalogenase